MVTEQQRNEVTSYLRSQAARLTVEQILAKRDAEVEALLISAAGLAEDEARWAPDGEWNALQILQHTHESFAMYRRAIRRLTGSAPVDDPDPLPPTATLAALAAGIRAQHAASQTLIRSVAEAPADRTAPSDFGDLNWREWALFERVHVKDHLLQIQALKEGMDTPGR